MHALLSALLSHHRNELKHLTVQYERTYSVPTYLGIMCSLVHVPTQKQSRVRYTTYN